MRNRQQGRKGPTSRSRVRFQNSINVNYCVHCVTGQEDFVYVSSKVDSLNPPPVLAGKKNLSVTSKRLTVKLHVISCVVSPVHFVKGYPQKKGVNCLNYTEIKYVKDISCIGHLSQMSLFSRSTCRGQIAPVLREVGSPRGQPKSANSTQGGLHPPPTPIRVPAQFDQVTNYVNSHKNLYLLEALHQLLNKNAVEPVATQKSLGFYNRLFLVPKPNNWWRLILDLSTLNTFLNTIVQNGDTRDSQNLPTDRGVGYFLRFQRRILPYTNSQSVQEVHVFSRPGWVLPV